MQPAISLSGVSCDFASEHLRRSVEMNADQSSADPNSLCFGDNLDDLRKHVADESVDLIYLDPPFNSNVNYDACFQEQTGELSDARITAFEDTWRWGPGSEGAYRAAVTEGT